MDDSVDKIDFYFEKGKHIKNANRIIDKGDFNQILTIFEKTTRSIYSFNRYQLEVLKNIYDFFDTSGIYNQAHFHQRLVDSILFYFTKHLSIQREFGERASKAMNSIIKNIRENSINLSLLDSISEILVEHTYICLRGAKHSGEWDSNFFRFACEILGNIGKEDLIKHFESFGDGFYGDWNIVSYLPHGKENVCDIAKLKIKLSNMAVDDSVELEKLTKYLRYTYDERGKMVAEFFDKINYLPKKGKHLYYLILGKKEFNEIDIEDFDRLKKGIEYELTKLSRDGNDDFRTTIMNDIQLFARVYVDKAIELLGMIFHNTNFFENYWRQEFWMKVYRNKDLIAYENLMNFLKTEKLWKE